MEKNGVGVHRLRALCLLVLMPLTLLASGCAAVLAELDRPMPTTNIALVSGSHVVNPPRAPLTLEQQPKPAQASGAPASPVNATAASSAEKAVAVKSRPSSYKAVLSGSAQRASFGSVIYNPSRYDFAAYGGSPRRSASRPTERVARVVAPRNRVELNFADRPFDVWERIRRGYGMPELSTPAAERSTYWYSAQPASIVRMAQRAVPYLFHIVEEIEKRGMPTELALLPFVESGMQPHARSSANAVGLWQFIPSTGRMYELEQNAWQDQRSHITESTRAALDYLEKLFDEFGHWHLALAAYNCGEGCVRRALNRARAGGNSGASYEELDLPYETRDYVPKLQALKNIVGNPEGYGLALPVIQNQPYFVAINKTRDMDIATAALLAEVTEEEFRTLNPAFKRSVIVGSSQSSILLPIDRKEVFDANLAAWQAAKLPLASWTTYTLQSADTLRDIARQVGMSEAALREANRIPPHDRVLSGATILIPRPKSATKDVVP